MRTTIWIGLALATVATPAFAQDGKKQDAGDIAEQPAKDVGAVKTRVPEILRKAAAAPYSLDGMGKCAAIAGEIRALSGELGEDYAGAVDTKKKRKFRVTGDTVASVIVPFRGLVREVSGAAPAQRELNAAIDAGFARRGFLRGVAQTRGCRV